MNPPDDPPDDLPGEHAYRDALKEATLRLGATTPADAGLPVSACPGWTVERLQMHVGRIHRWVAVALTSPEGRDVPPVARPSSGADLARWLADGVDHLLDAFTQAGPNGAVRSPGWEQPARWWLRRCTLETLVHAWDVEEAIGVPRPLPAALACAGVDEVIEVFIPSRFSATDFGAPATIRLVCTDVSDCAWVVALGEPEADQSPDTTREADVTVRATASDLLLLLWNRLGAGNVDVSGQAPVLGRYHAACNY